MNKIQARLRRGAKTKARLRCRPDRLSLIVYKSANHIYAQVTKTGDKGNLIVVCASTLDKELKATLSGTKVEQALQVGKLLGERAKAKGIVDVSFDRAGYKFHGRVKALAEGARQAGLNF